MAMIFQSYALWPHMTVDKNVAYGLRFGGASKTDRERRVRDILRAVQLEGYGARYPGELSGGQQQRVAVARALVVEPEILLLDEPLSNLDANLREEMRFEIRRLHELFGITTLYVTHDQAEAMVISDRVAVLQHGRVVQIGTAQELFDRPRTRFVAEFIGRTNLIDGVAGACGSPRGSSGRVRRWPSPSGPIRWSCYPPRPCCLPAVTAKTCFAGRSSAQAIWAMPWTIRSSSRREAPCSAWPAPLRSALTPARA